MKTKRTRILSAFMAFLIVFLLIPFGAISISAATVINFSDNPESHLGLSFNALSGEDITVGTINPQTWIKNDDTIPVYEFGDSNRILEQYSYATYAKSSLELLTKFGMDYTNSASAGFSLGKAKAGMSRKFNLGVNLSTTSTTSELYYYYTYKAVTNRYVLGNNYSDYLTPEFLNAVNAIDPNSEYSIAAFFNRYGTHMLTGFEMGGELYLSAWAFSEQNGVQVDVNLEHSIESSAGVGDIVSAEMANQIKINFTHSMESNGYTANTNMFAIGGEGIYANTTDASSLTLDQDELQSWVNTLPGKDVFLPETSEWVPVWEVLPQTAEYNRISECLYQYFLSHCGDMNAEFLKEYCSFNNRVTIAGYDYISPAGHVSQNVPYGTVNYVAPGSLVSLNANVDDSVFSIDSVTYELAPTCTAAHQIDRNGIIKIATNAGVGTTFEVYIKAGDIIIKTVKFEIAYEGGGIFSGGYGDEKRPYLLESATDIANLANNGSVSKGKYYMLTDDIDMFGIPFSGISEFEGTLDGNGYHIYGFSINVTPVPTGTVTGEDKITHINTGFIHINKGTIINLTIGRMGDTRVDGYSVKLSSVSKEHSDKETSLNVGGLVGRNDGVIDNCHVINTYVYGELKDANNNQHAWCVTGALAGRNKGTINRSSATHNYVNVKMPAKTDSGDNNYAYAGGFCGGNYDKMNHCISHSNTVYAYAYGNGKGANDAYPRTYVGGLSAYNESTIKTSTAFNNSLDGDVTDGGATSGDLYIAGLIARVKDVGGQEPCDLQQCYTVSTHAVVSRNDTKKEYASLKLNSITALNNMYANSTHFSIDSSGYLEINPISQVLVTDHQSNYVKGDLFNILGSQVYGTTVKNGDKFLAYSNGGYVPANFERFNIVGFSSTTPGNVNVTVTAYGGMQHTFTVNVAPVAMEKITIEKPPYKTFYYAGEALDTKGLSVFCFYNDGTIETIDKGLNVSGFDPDKIGKQTLTVDFNGCTTTYDVQVYYVKPVSISVQTAPTKVNYALGEEFDSTGLSVVVTYNNGKTEVINSGFQCSGFDSSAEGVKDITVAYTFYDSECAYNPQNGKAYKLVRERLTWQEAVTACEEMGGYLVTITSAEENAFVQSLIGENFAYIGATDQEEEGTWRWVTYEPFSYTNWATSEPNNLGGEQNYGLMYGSSYAEEAGRWDDAAEHELQECFVCEWDNAMDVGTNTTLYATFPVNVGSVSSVRVSQSPAKTQYFTSDTQLDITGLELEVTYSNGAKKVVSSGYSTPYGYNLSQAGIQHVTVEYSGCTTTFAINVVQKALESISVDTLPKTAYFVGDTLSTSGLCLTRRYNDGSVAVVWDGYTVAVDGYNEGEYPTFRSTGTKTVSVYYIEDGVRKFTTYEIQISEVKLTAIEIGQLPYKTVYKQNEVFNSNGMIVNAVYNNGKVESVYDYTVQYDFSQLGTRTIIVWYNNINATFDVTVRGPSYITVTSFPNTLEYTVGDTFDLTGLAVSAVYFDGSNIPLQNKDLVIDAVDMNVAGNKTVTVRYNDFETSFAITVKEYEITDASPVIGIGETSARAGETVTLDITMSNVAEVKSILLDQFVYDNTKLELVSFEWALEGAAIEDWDANEEVATIAFMHNIDANGVIARVTFKVLENTEVGDFAVSCSIAANQKLEAGGETAVTIYVVNGGVIVTTIIRGDLTDDGFVDSDDAIYLLRSTLNSDRYPANQDGDMNGDGYADSDDAIYLLRHTLSPTRYPLS